MPPCRRSLHAGSLPHRLRRPDRGPARSSSVASGQRVAGMGIVAKVPLHGLDIELESMARLFRETKRSPFRCERGGDQAVEIDDVAIGGEVLECQAVGRGGDEM